MGTSVSRAVGIPFHKCALLNVFHNFNMAVEGHSFVANSALASFIKDNVNSINPDIADQNIAVGGSVLADISGRAATLDSFLKTETDTVKNILCLYIGTNDFLNTAGTGLTSYNALKTYVLNRKTAGWKVFVFTCTKRTTYNAQGLIERDVFNNNLRNDLSLESSVYVIDTDTITELNDPANLTYYSDGLHPTAVGAYLINELFVKKIKDLYTIGSLPVETAVTPITLTATSSGTGAGIATVTILARRDINISLNNNAKFYTNSIATLGESASWDIKKGVASTMYMKCTSGAASFIISDNQLRKLSFISATNSPLLGGDISGLTRLTRLTDYSANTLSGNISNLTYLNYLQVEGTNTLSGDITGLVNSKSIICTGNNTLSGILSNLTNLEGVNISGTNTISGSVTNLTKLTVLLVLGSNTVSGSVTNLTKLTILYVTGSNTLSGSVVNLVLLTKLQVTGSNTLSGSIVGLVECQWLIGNSTMTYENVTNLTKLCYLHTGTAILTSENVNQILADFWANKDATGKTESVRIIRINGGSTSGAPTGQGITDKAALQLYRSPTPPGTAPLWTVDTK